MLNDIFRRRVHRGAQASAHEEPAELRHLIAELEERHA